MHNNIAHPTSMFRDFNHRWRKCNRLSYHRYRKSDFFFTGLGGYQHHSDTRLGSWLRRFHTVERESYKASNTAYNRAVLFNHPDVDLSVEEITKITGHTLWGPRFKRSWQE